MQVLTMEIMKKIIFKDVDDNIVYETKKEDKYIRR